MRCNQCDYPLWNLRARQCPECGCAFAPSQYEFVLNSVRFCCPHCNQDYYGTGARGHLEPPEFACVSCSNVIRMDDMILLPTEGVKEEQTETDSMPWLDRRAGRISAFFSTMIRALFEPPRLARALPGQPALGRAFLFALLCGGLPPVIGIGFLLIIPMVIIGTMAAGGGGGGPGGGMFLGLLGSMAGGVVLMAIAVMLLLGVWILSAHAILRMTGPVKGSLAHTVEPLCYGAAANFIVAIPCLGLYVWWAGLIWWSISSILMLRIRQEVSGSRATISVLALPVVLMTIGFIYALVVFIPMMQGAQAAARQMQQQQAQGGGAPGGVQTWPPGVYGGSGQIDVSSSTTVAREVARGITEYRDREGVWPGHALHLIAQNDIFAQNVILHGSVRPLEAVVIGPMDLQRFSLLPRNSQVSFARDAAAALPEGVVAHRLGDYIFTYHGLPLDPDPRLWIAVAHPSEADFSAVPTSDPILIIVDAGNSARPVRTSRFTEVLDEQNDLRRSLGLPAIPDPRDVGNEPATAPAR